MDRSVVKVKQAMFYQIIFLYPHVQGHYDDMLMVMNNKFKGFTLAKTGHQ